MSNSELLEFGVTLQQAEEKSAWIRNRMAIVLGADGKGGSGIFVRLNDGRLAILTARHVAIDCIITGEITVACIAKGGVRTVSPIGLQVADMNDAALLAVHDNGLCGNPIEFKDWTDAANMAVRGNPIILSGIVGERKTPIISKREISIIPSLTYWTKISDERNIHGMIVANINANDSESPKSFGGFSGGPAFSIDLNLLGIIIAENRRHTDDRAIQLYINPISTLKELVTPFHPSANSPTDYMRQSGRLVFTAKHKKTKFEVRIVANVEYYWSLANPDADDGQIGRIIDITIHAMPGSEDYLIQTESVFRWVEANTDSERLKAFQQQLLFFMDRMGFEYLANIDAN